MIKMYKCKLQNKIHPAEHHFFPICTCLKYTRWHHFTYSFKYILDRHASIPPNEASSEAHVYPTYSISRFFSPATSFISDIYMNKSCKYMLHSHNFGVWLWILILFLLCFFRDRDGNRKDSPDYSPQTLYVPDSFLNKQTPAMRQWWEMKSRHFDTILFFKVWTLCVCMHVFVCVSS